MHQIIENPESDIINAAWRRAGRSQRRAILWNLDYETRREALLEIMQGARHSFAIIYNGAPIALTWLEKHEQSQLTGAAHFFYCGEKRFSLLFEIAREMEAVWFIYLKSVICLVPGLWLGAQGLLLRLGFRKALLLEKLLPVNGRMSDITIWQKTAGQ